MMRALAAYLGPPIPAANVLPRSAIGDVPAFGLGWYRPEHGPIRTASRVPVSRGDAVLEVPSREDSHCILAHAGVRPGEAQPFRHGDLLFGFFGVLEAPQAVESTLMARLSERSRAANLDRTPEGLIFLTFLDELRDRTEPDDLADALEKTVGVVQDLATGHGTAATFTAVVTQGDCLVTLRTGTSGTEAALPPLRTLVTTDAGPGPAQGRWVCTEPAFAGDWTELDPHSLVIFTRDV
ncbi:MAG TPA: hypothetical protein RMG48_18480 [Myxococcales bacterium LLY-WYZ-16_1]|jgi:hypothetical protein|nr:hypothetical protein [Myxococcales bacterium LLY-WYZ-16_1]